VSTLIAYGHTVCYDIDVAGMRPADAQHQIWSQTDMDENQSIWFTIGAIDNYCPWDKNLMPAARPTQRVAPSHEANQP
jgi:Protein of unknown function (DUF732)